MKTKPEMIEGPQARAWCPRVSNVQALSTARKPGIEQQHLKLAVYFGGFFGEESEKTTENGRNWQ